ncbi:MAG: NUDIX domain-containing protein [Candidatus Nanoarchaeia archaeon]|nr:NUDIX domain-containing protein [Candidatus Nanoarchaeia archaeon]MDD5239709.1 NUDIX domain-containing protein [Candidatus Nanoarchaeia archaeon]
MSNEVSAGAVIFRREDGIVKYLFLHYKAGHWDYVKGHIEKGEAELETLKRECREETGITDLEIVPEFRHKIQYFYRNWKETVSKEVYMYLAETKTSTVKISFEHTGYEWLTYEEAMQRVTFANSRDLLKKANDIVTKL